MAKPMQMKIMTILNAAPYPYMCAADIVDELRRQGHVLSLNSVAANLGILRTKHRLVSKRKIEGGRPLTMRPRHMHSGPMVWCRPVTTYWFALSRKEEVQAPLLKNELYRMRFNNG